MQIFPQYLDFFLVPAVKRHGGGEHYIECALFGSKRINFSPGVWFDVELFGTLPSFRGLTSVTPPSGDNNTMWRVFLPGQKVQMHWDTLQFTVRGRDLIEYITMFASSHYVGRDRYSYQYYADGYAPVNDQRFVGMINGVGPPQIPIPWGQDVAVEGNEIDSHLAPM